MHMCTDSVHVPIKCAKTQYTMCTQVDRATDVLKLAEAFVHGNMNIDSREGYGLEMQ